MKSFLILSVLSVLVVFAASRPYDLLTQILEDEGREDDRELPERLKAAIITLVKEIKGKVDAGVKDEVIFKFGAMRYEAITKGVFHKIASAIATKAVHLFVESLKENGLDDVVEALKKLAEDKEEEMENEAKKQGERSHEDDEGEMEGSGGEGEDKEEKLKKAIQKIVEQIKEKIEAGEDREKVLKFIKLKFAKTLMSRMIRAAIAFHRRTTAFMLLQMRRNGLGVIAAKIENGIENAAEGGEGGKGKGGKGGKKGGKGGKKGGRGGKRNDEGEGDSDKKEGMEKLKEAIEKLAEKVKEKVDAGEEEREVARFGGRGFGEILQRAIHGAVRKIHKKALELLAGALRKNGLGDAADKIEAGIEKAQKELEAHLEGPTTSQPTGAL